LKLDDLSLILATLEAHAPKGVGIFTLAKETKLTAFTLRKYLAKYSDYFVKLPEEQSYQINRFGQFKGSTDEIIQHYEKTLADKKSGNNWIIYILFLSAFVSTGSALLNGQ